MFATATHVQHGHHLHSQLPLPSYNRIPDLPAPNGHAHHVVVASQPPPPQPPAHQPHRAPSAHAPKEPVHVMGIPSVTVQGDQLVVGDSQSSSPRSYTPLKVVGDGSFGTVWLCDWHGALPPNTPLSAMQANAGARPEYAGKRLVALKRMKRKWEGGWDECKKLKELESLRAITYHPNIIPLYDFFLLPASKELYFVFESMEGNLYQLIKSRKGRPLAGGLVASVFRQVVSGLHHIHASGYFHRDMKPENLLVTTTGLTDYPTMNPHAPAHAPPERDVVVIVKLADFGLAREIKSRPPYTEYVSTRWYRAPEVLLRARDYSAPVDMWALGTIMAELVDLRPLFPGQDEVDQVAKICAVLGDPSDDYGVDARGKSIGGGKWTKGIKMARAVGFTFPKAAPKNLFAHFDRSVPMRLVECIVDLIKYDPDARLTSRQCLDHPYLQEATQPVPSAPVLRQSTSMPSVHPRQNGVAPPVPPIPSYVARSVPPSHSHTSQGHGPHTKPAFNAAGHPVPAIPDASATHRAPFYPARGTVNYASSSDVGSSVYSYPGQGEPMDLSSSSTERDLPYPSGQVPVDPQATSPMVQDLDPIHEAGGALPAPVKLGKLGSLGFGKKSTKWGLGMFGGGDKHAVSTLPPVDEAPVPSLAAVPSLKRSQTSSSDTRSSLDHGAEKAAAPMDPKLVKKEAQRMAREAEIQRRALAEKAARDQARAVMQKRNQALMAGRIDTTDGNMVWQQAATYYDMHANAAGAQQREIKGKRAVTGAVRSPPHAPSAASTLSAAAGRFLSNPAAGDNAGGPGSGIIDARWRDDQRMAKARRRDWDDDHSMSSSDVQSVGRMSAVSFQTVDSDPGPGPQRLRARPSLFGMDRMTSTSSLRTSFDDFPQSVRSSNSLSFEHPIAEDLHSIASSDHSGTSSPPPMHLLSLSPTQRSWQSPTTGNASPTSGAFTGRPSFIALPPQRIARPAQHLHPPSSSPYEYTGTNAAFGHPPGPPSPGWSAPKSAINPMFKVTSPPPVESLYIGSPLSPPPPLSPSPAPASPTPMLPPCSQLEAVAEGEYPPLSPMSFTSPDGS